MQPEKFLQTKLGASLEMLLFFAVAMSTFQLGIIIPILIVLAIGVAAAVLIFRRA